MNDSMRVSNKIISAEVLNEIFDRMNDKVEQLKRIAREDERKNAVLDYQYQNYAYKDSGTELVFNVYYYDNTSIKYDNYANFIGTFRNRLEDIKEIDVNLRLSYSVKEQGSQSKYYSQRISLSVYEHKASMDFSLDSSDKKIEDLYLFIKEKIQSSPVKYDYIIKKKGMISNTIGFAKGFIPAIIIGISLLFVGEVRDIMSASYILFPIGVTVLTFMIGSAIFTSSILNLYKNITPKVEYAGYSQSRGTSIYKENIDQYTETSEILIGKNTNNMSKRTTIEEKYIKYKKYIPYELGILAVLSLIVIFL